MIAQVDACAVQAALERVHRDRELRGGLRGAQPLDVAEQDDLAVDRLEGSNRGLLDAGLALLAEPFTPKELVRKMREVLDSPLRRPHP